METRMPKMLSANQIEAHVTRLTAVREGLRKYEGDDSRAMEAGCIIEAAIATLQQEVPVPQKAAEDAAAPIEEVADDQNDNPIDLQPPTPIRPDSDQEDVRQKEDEPASEVEEADPSEVTD